MNLFESILRRTGLTPTEAISGICRSAVAGRGAQKRPNKGVYLLPLILSVFKPGRRTVLGCLKHLLRVSGSLAFLCAFVCVPSRGLGYATLDADPFTPVRWPVDSVPVFLDVRGGGGHAVNDIEPAILSALITFNEVSCSRLAMYYGGLIAESVGTGVYIHWVDPNTSPDILAPDTAGVTETYHDAEGNILRADMHLNAQYQWTLGGALFDPSVVDIQAVVTHELGHAIGLAHTRHRQATMFFSGGDATLRTFDDDDIAAICYVYGEYGYVSGKACDSCTHDTECSGIGSRCLHFPSNNGFCAPVCVEDADCLGGFTCVDIPKAKSRHCLPSNGHCAETGQNIDLGDYCYGNSTCMSDYCLTTPYSAYCTGFCDPDDMGECGSGFLCAPIIAGACLAVTGGMQCGLCLRYGSGSIGDPCYGPSECERALCLTAPGQKGHCSATCDNHTKFCPDGAECALGVCATSGPKPTGATCVSPFECQGKYCVPVGTNVSRCTQVCDNGTPCPSNTTCAEFDVTTACVSSADCNLQQCSTQHGICTCTTDEECGEGRVCGYSSETPEIKVCKTSLCVLLNKKAKPGEYCVVDADCVGGALCDLRAPDWGLCYAACTPGTDAGCINALCEWTNMTTPDGKPIGHCGPPIGGGTKGQDCGIDNPCERNLACAAVDGVAQLCYQDCLVSNGDGCKNGEECVDGKHPDFPGRGVCLSELSEPTSTATLIVVTPIIDGDIVESDMQVPGVDLGPPGGGDLNGADYPPLSSVSKRQNNDGCRTNGGGTGPLPPLMFLPFLFVCLRHRGCRILLNSPLRMVCRVRTQKHRSLWE